MLASLTTQQLAYVTWLDWKGDDRTFISLKSIIYGGTFIHGSHHRKLGITSNDLSHVSLPQDIFCSLRSTENENTIFCSFLLLRRRHSSAEVQSPPFAPLQAGVLITSVADGTKVAWSFTVFLQMIGHVRCPQILPANLARNFVFMARKVWAQPVAGSKGSIASLWTAAEPC